MTTARWKQLVSWRWSHRERYIFLAVALSGIFFVFDWAGSNGGLIPWGDPRSFVDVWWRFPLYFTFCLALMIFWPWLQRGESP